MTRARMPRPHEVAAAQRDPRLLRAISERDAGPGWRTRGACRTVDPETFFPAPSEPADAAVALCRTCTVQGPCLAWALEVGDTHGVWGATTPRERRAMLVAWRSLPVPAVRPAPLAAQLIPASLAGLGEPELTRDRPVVVRTGPAAQRGTAEPAPERRTEPADPLSLELARRSLADEFDAALADQLACLDELVEQVPV